MAASPTKKSTSRSRRLKVACFEGNWDSDMRARNSVLPVLEFLDHGKFIDYFHRPVANKEQFLTDIRKWVDQKRYDSYDVAFIATHGDPEALRFGRQSLSLTDLADELAGSLRGRIVYFGSCSTASDSLQARTQRFRRVLKRFHETTNAKAVCGYVVDVDFVEAAAFEILLLSWLASYKQKTSALRFVTDQYRDLVKHLGFVVEPPPKARRPRGGPSQ